MVFVALKLKKYCGMIGEEHFHPLNLRKRFLQNMWFLRNHKDNYGALYKPKYSTSKEYFFLQLQKTLHLRIFQAFSQ